MILTETNTGRFLCVVNSTLERFIESINIDNIEMLSVAIPDIMDIDPYNALSVDLRPVTTGRVGSSTTSWEIEIFGDEGVLDLTLTKYPPEWN